MKFAFVTSHPIQYQVPVFRHLDAADGVDFTAIFAMLPSAMQQGAEFGVEFKWDIPLLEGYRYHVLENVSKNPGLMHYTGCDTPGISEFLKQEQFDVVAINGWVVKTCLQAARACKRLRIPAIVRGEANNLRSRAWWKSMVHRRIMKLFSAYCPIGQASAAFYRNLGISDEKLFLSPYCIENERISAISPKDDGSVTRARERFGVRSGCCCFLFCGKLIDKKQPLGLLEALKQAVRAGADAHLLIVGEGELRHECDAFCRAHDLPVTFTGFLNQSEIGMAYSASDALVLPSNDGETWGLVVNEAFAAGLPALVSDKVGCHPDLIDKSATGWVHRFGDWQQLSRQMIAAAEDVERLAEYGDNAKRRIQNYSPLHAAEGLLKAAAFVNQNSAR